DGLRMVADHADRAAAQTHGLRRLRDACEYNGGVDRGIEEQIEVVVRERLAAHGGELRCAATVGEDDEDDRRLDEPRHFRKQASDGMALSFVANNQNIALLKIALCRRR